MSERIHRVMDGELPEARLREAEARELDAYQEAADAALAGIRSEHPSDVSARVMRRVAELQQYGDRRDPVWRRAWDTFWRPRTVSFRPAWGVAVAAFCGLLLLAPWAQETAPMAPVTATAPTGSARVFVHFQLEAPAATTVALAGDFTEWQPRHELSRAESGVWSVVVPMEPGVHQYGFVVDGERWTVDPLAPVVDDGFGGSNSRLEVLGPEWRAS